MFESLLSIGSKLIDRLIPDKQAQDAAKLRLMELEQTGELQKISGQLDINKTEAANPSVFVSGWRPFIGWVCGVGVGVQFVVGPLVNWGSIVVGRPVSLPELDLSVLLTLLAGMLGMGTLRTYEKVNKVARQK